MRISAVGLAVPLLVVFSALSHADVVVTEAFHVDPGWEAGGYWELTVNNMTLGDVYMIAVGNVGADLVVVRYPDLTGVWAPDRISKDAWETNDWPTHPIDWTRPDTSLIPFAIEFPGATQALVYYVMGSNPPLGVGATLTGLYFNYPIPQVAAAPRLPATAAGSHFLVFNGAGDVVARGQTVGAPLAVENSTWGAVKALYR